MPRLKRHAHPRAPYMSAPWREIVVHATFLPEIAVEKSTKPCEGSKHYLSARHHHHAFGGSRKLEKEMARAIAYNRVAYRRRRPRYRSAHIEASVWAKCRSGRACCLA